MAEYLTLSAENFHCLRLAAPRDLGAKAELPLVLAEAYVVAVDNLGAVLADIRGALAGNLEEGLVVDNLDVGLVGDILGVDLVVGNLGVDLVAGNLEVNLVAGNLEVGPVDSLECPGVVLVGKVEGNPEVARNFGEGAVEAVVDLDIGGDIAGEVVGIAEVAAGVVDKEYLADIDWAGYIDWAGEVGDNLEALALAEEVENSLEAWAEGPDDWQEKLTTTSQATLD